MVDILLCSIPHSYGGSVFGLWDRPFGIPGASFFFGGEFKLNNNYSQTCLFPRVLSMLLAIGYY